MNQELNNQASVPMERNLTLPFTIIKSGLLVGLIINLVHIGLLIFISNYDWNIYADPTRITNPAFLYLYEALGNFIAGIIIMIVFRGFFISYKKNYFSSAIKSSILIWLVSRVFNADLVILKVIPLQIFMVISLWLGCAYLIAGGVGALYFRSVYRFKQLENNLSDIKSENLSTIENLNNK